jgi:hypothetical protein
MLVILCTDPRGRIKTLGEPRVQERRTEAARSAAHEFIQ